MFFLFPDPHFKKSKHKWRIINETLLAEYAYVLREGGRLYTVTDVEDLFEWEVKHLTAHPLFRRLKFAIQCGIKIIEIYRRLASSEQEADPVVAKLFESSEEGQKVTRNSGSKWCAVFERVAAPTR